jgi:hypothetical protein
MFHWTVSPVLMLTVPGEKKSSSTLTKTVTASAGMGLKANSPIVKRSNKKEIKIHPDFDLVDRPMLFMALPPSR